jgi:endonuclease/exonuclease/phosphatase (EEP) superfamily protein YafD
MIVATEPAVRRRTGVRAGLVLLTVGCLAWAGVRAVGLENDGALVLLVAFTPYVAAGSVAVLLAALLSQHWWAAGFAAVAAVTLALCVLPRWTGGPEAGGDRPRLRVLSANLLVGDADATAVVDLVRRQRVDLLAVQEFTPESERALDAAGIAALLPHRVSHPAPGVVGSGVFSRHPLRDDGLRVNPSSFTQARATVTVPGARAVAVESAHPCAPASPAMARCWRTDMDREPPATPGGPLRVLVGDLNATLDHAALRRLIATGYRDAADVTGRGFAGTWPYDEKWFVPAVTLDHVLADRRIGITGYEVFPIPRGDHRAVLAELALPS